MHICQESTHSEPQTRYLLRSAKFSMQIVPRNRKQLAMGEWHHCTTANTCEKLEYRVPKCVAVLLDHGLTVSRSHCIPSPAARATDIVAFG